MPYRAGVTLIEMLIAIVVSSIIMIVAGTLYQTGMVNYSVVRDVRENLYATNLTNDRITEAMRRADPDDVKVVADPVSSGNSVIVYNFISSMYRSDVSSWSGIVYYFEEKVFIFENRIGTDSTFPYGDSFTVVPDSHNFLTKDTTALDTWINTAVNRRQSDVIGYGVKTFTATAQEWVEDGGTRHAMPPTWQLEYLQAGRI